MDNFLIMLTLCGSLHTGGYGCEDFILDTEQTEISCLQGVQGVYNRDNQKLITLISEASNDWYESINLSKLQCVVEDKE